MLYELYKDKAAFDAHWNSASIQQTRKDTAGLSLGLTGIRCDLVE
jgi:quinol monooxygenase YgiN